MLVICILKLTCIAMSKYSSIYFSSLVLGYYNNNKFIHPENKKCYHEETFSELSKDINWK
jgi:hypothetical protein